jgi:hypothetical protein
MNVIIYGLVDGSIGRAANMNEGSLPRLWRDAKLYDIGTGIYRSRRVLLDCALYTQS